MNILLSILIWKKNWFQKLLFSIPSPSGLLPSGSWLEGLFCVWAIYALRLSKRKKAPPANCPKTEGQRGSEMKNYRRWFQFFGHYSGRNRHWKMVGFFRNFTFGLIFGISIISSGITIPGISGSCSGRLKMLELWRDVFSCSSVSVSVFESTGSSSSSIEFVKSSKSLFPSILVTEKMCFCIWISESMKFHVFS